MRVLTEQEQLWQGAFGDDYIGRNNGERLVSSNIALFSQILKRTSGVSSILELGANIGLNLIAINTLPPEGKLVISAVEINRNA